MDTLKFTCPKCAHDRVRSVGSGMYACNGCGFRAVRASFGLEKRPGLRWDEAVDRHSGTYGYPHDNHE